MRPGGRPSAAVLRNAYGVLLGILPVLSIAASNAGEYTNDDLASVLALAVLGFAIVYGLSLLVMRGDAERAGFLTVLAAVWVWCYLPVHDWLHGFTPVFASHAVLLPLGAMATVALLLVLSRRRRVQAGLTRWLAMTGCIAGAWLVASIVREQAAARRTIARSPFLQSLSAPVPVRTAATPAAKPDVYVIVLDSYAGVHGLRDYLRFDNQPFIDSLRAIGFTVPERVVSNYMQTVLSVPSFLNMTLLTPLTREVDTASRNVEPLFWLLEHNRAMRVAKAAGYHVIGFPSAWWRGTSRMPEADEVPRVYTSWNVSRWLNATQLRDVTLSRSIFRMVQARTHEGATASAPEFALRTFEALERIPGDTRPTFVFAHLLLPHPPYGLDAECRLFTPKTRNDAWGKPLRGYVNQLQCTNKLLLGLVHTLIDQSSTPPVIVLQGDHGSRVTGLVDTAPGVLNTEQLREAFDTFGAYYLPGDSTGTFRDGVSVVNVLRAVFAHYAGADLPPLRDSLFYSTKDLPLKLTAVDTTAFFVPAHR